MLFIAACIKPTEQGRNFNFEILNRSDMVMMMNDDDDDDVINSNIYLFININSLLAYDAEN